MTTPQFGYTIEEFRTLHGYGEAAFKALRKAGLAPRVTLMPGTQFARITAEDYDAWLKLITAPDCQIKEFERRRARYSAQGLRAAQSPTHPAQVWKRFNELTNKPPRPKKVLGRPAGRPRKMQAAE